jgi:LDH2 family malate/lactate/ureidoglycolate dehydrogenase
MKTGCDMAWRVDADSLAGFCRGVFGKLGVSKADARIVADVLVEADLRGIPSHGVARMRSFYVRRLQTGIMNPRPDVRIVRDTPVTALLDGGGGLGHPTACRAMTLAMRKARRTGVGFVTVRNSNHFGIAGYYAMMALDKGCIGLAMTTSNRWVVPTFGRDAMLGTNPIAVAAPAGGEHPFVLDMATSTVTIGKLEVHERLGLPIPLQWATDGDGRASADPGAVMRNVRALTGGGLFPLGGAGEETGGHKGYGLAAWVDIFSALLSGAPCSDRNSELDADGKARSGDIGHFFGVWRVEAFRPLAEFRAGMDDWLRRLKASPKAVGAERIYIAGEKEFEEADRRRREGIPLPEPVVLDLRNLGHELGVEPIACKRKQR